MPEKKNHVQKSSASRKVAKLKGGITIEILRSLGNDDIEPLMKISQSLVESFGLNLLATRKDIQKYFNPPETHPFIARKKDGTLIGFIIGIPLEAFAGTVIASIDENLGKENTLYTYSFCVDSAYRRKGVAKALKESYLMWSRKKGYDFISGNVAEGRAGQLDGQIEVLARFEDWNNTSLSFDYYRRTL